MQDLAIGRVFTLLEPGPVVMVTTHADGHDNVMAISWTMVLDFSGKFAITTGPWNHSYQALIGSGECVVAVPTAPLLDRVVGVGTCSGRAVDKFDRFALRRLPAAQVRAPLLADCLANIECRVVDVVRAHDIVVLQAVAAHWDETATQTALIHAVGDGTFVEDGRRFDRREAMRSKLPAGIDTGRPSH